MISQIIATFIQAIFVLLAAPFVVGFVRLCKARLQGRKGASPFLPYFALLSLLRKETVRPAASSWIFRFAPIAVLASTLLLVLVVPTLFVGTSFAGFSDFVVLAGLLMLASIFMVLGGMDTGSAFGGMGSSREMTIAALLEPVMIVALASFSMAVDKSGLDGMLQGGADIHEPFFLLFLFALGLATLAENARYPVDNPATHLELTMVHEAMLLEYSGRYLAFTEYASAVKLTVFGLLFTGFIFPATVPAAAGADSYVLALSVVSALARLLFFAALVGFIEMILVKMRFYRMGEYFSVAFVVALLAFFAAFFVPVLDTGLPIHSIFAVLALVPVVILFGQVRLKAMIRYYALSSLALAGIAWGMMYVGEHSESAHLAIFVAFTIITKSIAIPYVIRRIGRAKMSLTNLPSFTKPGKSYMLAFALLIVSFFSLRNIPLAGFSDAYILLYSAVALIILGIFLMVIKRNIFAEIIGLLVIENGIAVFVLASVGSLPIMIEFGIFGVTVATAYILAILSARISELYGSTDTEELRTLFD